MIIMEKEIILRKYYDLCQRLKSEINSGGFWKGYLSTSALSTAVAIVALKVNGDPVDKDRIKAGFDWLCKNINSDGGYGDTTNSLSNVSTTLLCYSAISYCQTEGSCSSLLQKMERWLSGNGIDLNPHTITNTILKFYGKDYTFSVPILSMLTICGVIPESCINNIPRLPFELAILPQRFYRFLNLGVVSYALPALIGVGIYLHRAGKRTYGLYGKIRTLLIEPAIKKLEKLVPESGGFLEAIPLTGFVVMCLKAAGKSDNSIIEKGLEFLRRQQREDGGWSVDTDLSTWITTLAIKAFGNDLRNQFDDMQIQVLRKHILSLQYSVKHPFNGAKPGGWGWTNYSGSVPDADDTSGAILALLEIYSEAEEEKRAIIDGCKWLASLQNSDGGFPTFCKGWGHLPFDSSCPDITGHAILASVRTKAVLSSYLTRKIRNKLDNCVNRAVKYLEKNQSINGEWVPLWFGNQQTADKTNPVYGTAKVCTYLIDSLKFITSCTELSNRIRKLIRKAQDYLIGSQNPDGSWGGGKGVAGSVEETALSLCALAGENEKICEKGIEWLEKQNFEHASPIGLYFALLWYYEKMYPLIFSTEAYRRMASN